MQEPSKIGNELFFLQNLVDKAESLTRHVDSQTSILIGLCTALFAFSVNAHGGESQVPFILLAFFSAVAAILALLAVRPPEFMRKRGQKESMLYKHSIRRFETDAAFAESLAKMMEDRKRFYHEYALAIRNTYRFYYQPKRKLYNYARDFLILGVICSLGAYLMQSAGLF